MTKIFTKLRALVDEALSDSDTTVKKVSPVQQSTFRTRFI